MARIEFDGGRFGLVDEDDVALVLQGTWHIANRKSGLSYVSGRLAGMKSLVYLHHLILPPVAGFVVDHINDNGLDNRRGNLRLITQADNIRRKRSSPDHGTSKYRGVHWHKSAERWRATICVGCKRVSLGMFSSEDDAALAYNKAAKEAFGEFARLNTPPQRTEGDR